jgi:hypothetical protein
MSRWWCKKMHSKAMWPIHGRYICPDCHREYPVTWEATPPATEYRRPPEPQAEEAADRVSWSAKVLLQRAAGLKRF